MAPENASVPEQNPEPSSEGALPTPHYDVTALQITIWFNKDGDHDHNGMMFALTANVTGTSCARSGCPSSAWTRGTPRRRCPSS